MIVRSLGTVRLRNRIRALLLSACAAPLLSGHAATLDVPLTVWNLAGVERRQELCSSGVPLPCGLLQEPDGLAVFDDAGRALPAQFRVLERWRNAGDAQGDLSIRWLLVTFPVDVPTNGCAVYRLRPGVNPAPAAPVRAVDRGEAWDLGGMTIRKDLTGPLRLVLTQPDGREIGTAGQPIRWSVWENGPLRACLKAESDTDHERFGFIAWLYAYAAPAAAGRSGPVRCDMTVALKNTPNEPRGPFYFKDFSVVWEPPELAGARDFMLGGEWGKPVAGKLDAATPVHLMQASCGTDKWDKPDGNSNLVMDWSKELNMARAGIGAFRGYKVFAGDREIASGDFAAGWAALGSARASGSVSLRDYHHQWPKASEVSAGRITLRLWPKYARGFDGLHWLDDITRKAHDLCFRLEPRPPAAAAVEAADRAFNHPLVASVAPDWLRANGLIRPSGARNPPKPFAGGTTAALSGSGRNWVTWGGDITDRIRRRYHGADMGAFLQSGDPGQAYTLLRTARHSSGLTPLWLDDYQYPRDVRKLTHAQYCGLARDAGQYRPGTARYGFCSWNDAHFCCQEVFDAWRIWGDPLAFEALVTIGRWCQAWVDFREGGGGLVAGTRADGLPFHNMAETYRILGDASMRQSLDRMAEVSWRQVNKARGNYGEMDSWEGGKDRCEKPFMMAQVMQGLRAHYEISGSERTADQMYGMADFILAEAGIGEWGYKYVVMIDPERNKAHLATSLADAAKDGRHLSYGNLAWVMAWVHRHFGDARFRAHIDGLNKKAYPYTRVDYLNYYPEREDRTAPGMVTDLAAEAPGDGRVKLTWSAPAGEPVRYQVKWAERTLVERLDFPAQVETHANWWAANHVSGEPQPGPAGARESMTIDGLAPGKHFFAVRAFDAASNRGGIGNVVVAEVR